MQVITRSRLETFWKNRPNSETSLLLWYKRTVTSNWPNFVELRKVFPSADQVGNFAVFSISGNKYRLITFIDYTHRKVFIRAVLTHAEYDKDDWKKDSWYQ
ncbi:MAG: type II toxin-antitoxin system HigB family toxin [Leptolyngbyaceae cyanobacterium SM1_3_5]|nr:type II toxin-antitoxin system HigB family toxin [Leptolyngbyaceae cyanobacterium SM1_3_5]